MSHINEPNCCGRKPRAYDLTPFGTFFGATPVLPSLYWDVYSAEQRWKAMGELIKKLCEYVEYMGGEINVDRDTINQLLEDFEKFKESGFDDYYKEQIEQWISDNLVTVMQALLNQGIFFGLTDDGYFCANVLLQLTIYFDTIMDYSSDDYGKLTLTY